MSPPWGRLSRYLLFRERAKANTCAEKAISDRVAKAVTMIAKLLFIIDPPSGLSPGR